MLQGNGGDAGAFNALRSADIDHPVVATAEIRAPDGELGLAVEKEIAVEAGDHHHVLSQDVRHRINRAVPDGHVESLAALNDRCGGSPFRAESCVRLSRVGLLCARHGNRQNHRPEHLPDEGSSLHHCARVFNTARALSKRACMRGVATSP